MRIRRKMAEETNKEELPKNGSEGDVAFQELAAELMKRVESLEKSLEQYRKEEKASRRKTVEELLKDCREEGVPFFMKGNLAGVWGEELIQELPGGLQRG